MVKNFTTFGPLANHTLSEIARGDLTVVSKIDETIIEVPLKGFPYACIINENILLPPRHKNAGSLERCMSKSRVCCG